MKRKLPATGLTDLESHVLSVVWRIQPVTAYEIRLALSQTPVREYILSQGSIYPLVERLEGGGFIRVTSAGDGRGTKHLTCTDAGERAIKEWLFAIPAHVPPDPVRTRIISLGILTDQERRDWLEAAHEALSQGLASAQAFAEANPGLFFDMAHDNARSTLLARIRWLERIERKLVPPD